MRVQCIPMPVAEARAFEGAIRDSGRDPDAFQAQVFQATGEQGEARGMRRVHVVTRRGAAQYDASDGVGWMESFARHLARGFFG